MQLTPNFTLGETGLRVTGQPSQEEWEEAGHRLRTAEKGHQWGIGDWLIYGDTIGQWGQTWEKAEVIYGADHLRTLREYARVSSVLNFGTRVPKLTWKHHRHVASLSEDEQQEWLAAALEGTDGKKWSAAQLKREIKNEKLGQKRQEALLVAPEGVEPGEVIRSGVYAGDFRELMPRVPDDSVDLILTDPPYDEDSIPLYFAAAEHAARVLRPGGSLIAFAPHYALGRVITGMESYLRFWWTLAVRHTGGNRRFPGKWVFVGWKPMVWFVKGSRSSDQFVSDFIESEADFWDGDGTRQLHKWQQGTKEAEYLIGELTAAGGLVLDPMCGSGTNGLAAAKLGREFIGMDLDPENAAIARGRINDNAGVGAA